jgi:hypothetical protein
MKTQTYEAIPKKGIITSTRTALGTLITSSRGGTNFTLKEEMNGAWSDRRICLLIHEVYQQAKKNVTKELKAKASKKKKAATLP